MSCRPGCGIRASLNCSVRTRGCSQQRALRPAVWTTYRRPGAGRRGRSRRRGCWSRRHVRAARNTSLRRLQTPLHCRLFRLVAGLYTCPRGLQLGRTITRARIGRACLLRLGNGGITIREAALRCRIGILTAALQGGATAGDTLRVWLARYRGGAGGNTRLPAALTLVDGRIEGVAAGLQTRAQCSLRGLARWGRMVGRAGILLRLTRIAAGRVRARLGCDTGAAQAQRIKLPTIQQTL